MTMTLPGPIAAYFAAEKNADPEALSRCFGPDGTVHDEGGTFTGPVAIKDWNTAARAKYHHTVEPLRVVDRDGTTVVIGRVSGDFPGSPVELEHLFTLRGNRIASLKIR